jgi:hypothetical protein
VLHEPHNLCTAPGKHFYASPDLALNLLKGKLYFLKQFVGFGSTKMMQLLAAPASHF